MRIIIDADACPKSVLEICKQQGRLYSLPVWTIASISHNIESDNHIVVDKGSQMADLKVMNIVQGNDIVITQDWGLAAIVLGKKAKCISPTGKEFRNDNIEFLLEERESKAKFRRAGGRTKGPDKRTKEDDVRFKHVLEKVIIEANSPNIEKI